MKNHYQDKSNHRKFLNLLIRVSDEAKKADKKTKKVFFHDVLEAMKNAGMHWDTADKDGKRIPAADDETPALSTIKKHRKRCIDILELNGEKNGVDSEVIKEWKKEMGKKILMIKDVPETGGVVDESTFTDWF